VQRRQNLLDFTAGRISAVTAVDVLNEGIDVPDVNILVFMRATHSRRIFIQQLGRGLRLAPGKSKVIVLDFVSDLRRLADLSSMDAAYRTKMKGREDLLIKDHIVSFSNAEAENFVQEWIRDAADLETDSGDFALDFPIWD
jgi:superfamily II DNA or RNA helicase